MGKARLVPAPRWWEVKQDKGISAHRTWARCLCGSGQCPDLGGGTATHPETLTGYREGKGLVSVESLLSIYFVPKIRRGGSCLSLEGGGAVFVAISTMSIQEL